MGAISESADSNSERGEAFWRPPTGFGNGLPAAAWAIIVDLSERQTYRALAALAEAGIAALADFAPGADGRRDITGASGYRLRVDPHRYTAAEDVLMDLMRHPVKPKRGNR